jgi:outer membrane protein OmpA-like peptidoglycan-associated protein
MPNGQNAQLDGSTVRKALVAAACLLMAHPAFAQIGGAPAPAAAGSTAAQELAGPTRAPAMRAATDAMPEAPDAPPDEIQFPPGSAHLTPSATRLLDRLGRMLSPPDRIWLEGHADGAGADRDLATRRAQAVAGYLEQNCGVSPDRVGMSASLRMPRREVRIRILGD